MTQHTSVPSAPAGQRVGYARVSTTDQRLDRQVEALGQVDRLFTDEASGSSRARPGLEAALGYVRDGDELVVTSMDRLARSVRDLVDIVEELTGRGVTVIFLREAQTYRPGRNDPTSDLMLGLLGAVAQFERAIIRDRPRCSLRCRSHGSRQRDFAARKRKIRSSRPDQSRFPVAPSCLRL